MRPTDCGADFSIFTHLTRRERLLLFNLAADLDDGATIVEIGSYLGASTTFLAAGARWRGGRVHAVDTWTNIGMSEGPRDTYEEFLTNTGQLRDIIVPLRGRSTEMALQVQAPIDLLFVDGDHSYNAVAKDLGTWLPKVRKNGVVVFHDYGWAEGIQRAVREFILPIQVNRGHREDSIYWTRVDPTRSKVRSEYPTASVIIPTYDRPSYLRDAVESVSDQEFSPSEYEIVIVDNRPTGEVRAIVRDLEKSHGRPIVFVEEPRPGLHNARHTGAMAATGRILVYIDDDILAPRHWLTHIIEPFADPAVAVVGSKVLPHWEKTPPTWVTQLPPYYLSLLDLGPDDRELHWPEGVHGCNMAVRFSAFYEVGGFNPDGLPDKGRIWWRGDGETGLHRKLYDVGYKVIYTPHAPIRHRIPHTRMQREYFNRRAFSQGISDSYSTIRRRTKRHTSSMRMLQHGASCLLRAGKFMLPATFNREEAPKRRVAAWYWYGRGRHQLRTALHPSLLEYIVRDSYLQEALTGWKAGPTRVETPSLPPRNRSG